MNYKYVEDVEKLSQVINILANHEAETRDYYLSHLAQQLGGVGGAKDRLVTLFAIANRQRRGAGPDNLRQAANMFYWQLDENLAKCHGLQPEVAHNSFLAWLCSIDWVEQKTANLFLKWLAMFQADFDIGLLDWQSWECYLHVPLDRWVLKLLSRGHLAVCTEDYERDLRGGRAAQNLGFGKPGYEGLQKDLAILAPSVQKAPITLDVLWFVGSMYCAYWPLLCRNCWIGEKCAGNSEVQLGIEPAPARKQLREARKQAEKQLIRKYPNEFRQLVEHYRRELTEK